MRYKKSLLALLGILMLAISLASCTGGDSSTTDQTNAAASAESSSAGAGLDLIFANQPVPIFATSAYRRQLTEIEAVEALGTPTTAFMMPPGWGSSNGGPLPHPFKTCPAQGLPIPNSTQLTNPDEIVQDPYGGGTNLNNGGLVIPRADPIGVYTPTTGTGTYVTCLGRGGSLVAAYWEGDVYAEAAPAIWDQSTGMIQDIGPGTLPVCTVETAGKGTLPDGSTADPNGISYGTAFTHCVPKPGTAAHVWGHLDHTASGIVLTRYESSQMVVSCSLRNASYLDITGKIHKDGVVSACQFPDGTNLTFAPWGVVSSK